jgi:hypothetical protein
MFRKLKEAVQGLTNIQKAVLTFIVAVAPPVIILLQEQNSNPFLYGAAILGGIFAFAVKMLSDAEQ